MMLEEPGLHQVSRADDDERRDVVHVGEGDAGRDRRKNNGNEEGLRNSHSLGVPPNEMRLSCGAERERSQTEFYDTGRRSAQESLGHGRRQLQACVRWHHKCTSRWAVPSGPGRICTRAFWQSDDARNVASTPRNRSSALDPYMNRVAPSSPTSFPSYSPSPCRSITSVSRVSSVHRSSSGSVDARRGGGDSRTTTACSYSGRRGGLPTRDWIRLYSRLLTTMIAIAAPMPMSH